MPIRFEHTKVYNFEGALRGMRNPLDSHEKADSIFPEAGKVIIGPNDMDLCKRLIKGGSEHRKFLRQIFVCVDIIAPRFLWSEADTYKVGTVANSCSTMHKGMSYEFNDDMFAIGRYEECDEIDLNFWSHVITYLNHLRNEYKRAKTQQQKDELLHKLKCALPEGFLQKRTWSGNYENIYNMYNQREFHRLPEWRIGFKEWAVTLPYFKEFFLDE